MPTNWDTIPALKIITAENITDAVNAEKLVPNTGYGTMGTPKLGMTLRRMSGSVASTEGTVFYDTSNVYYAAKAAGYVYSNPNTGLKLLARQDITALRPNIGYEARTILPFAYTSLSNLNKANFDSAGYKPSENASGSIGGSSRYTIGQLFLYAFHFINTGTLVTQGNVVFTITIPNGLSCFLSGGQPVITHIRGGDIKTPSVAPTLVGNTLTITVTEPTNPYNISTNPAAYHVSVLMTSSLYSGWDNGTPPPAIVYMPTVSTTPYAINKPLSSDFYISLNYAALTITKTNPYASTIAFNQLFEYTMVIRNFSTTSATGVVFTDVLPTGVTFVSMTEVPAGWTASVSGQTVTVNSNSNNIPPNQTSSFYTIRIQVRATSENTNISNTASVSGTNSFSASATKTNYIDFNRGPILVSQGYSTCSSGVTYLVYRDTNTLSATYNQYYVNSVSVGNTPPSNGACSYSATAIAAYQVTGTRNNCTNNCYPQTTVVGSTVYLNYAGYPTYETGGSYTSSISQADANAQAQAIADAAFYSGLQARINSEGFCTWTASNIAGNHNANFTKNNCPANCYGNGTVNYASPTQYASAVSTTSCESAVASASTAAFNMAVANVNANGQNFANANGTCCCWNPASEVEKCDGCNYRGNLEKNSCDSSFRNTEVTQSNYCGCNQNCQGTTYNNRCVGDGLKDRQYYQVYNCNGAETGASYIVTCDCDAKQPNIVPTSYTTCSNCFNVTIYIDNNRCSPSYNRYFVNGSNVGVDLPSTAPCNDTPSYIDDLGVKCVNGTNYYVSANVNPCGNYRYIYYNGDEGNYTNDANIINPACTFQASRSGTFTRNNCGAGFIGGSVSYSNTYYYSGINNQSGAEDLADANFANDGQNYANANGTCTAIQVCKVYDIVAFDSGYYVDGYYTYCNGGIGYFSFYADSSGVIGQVPCVNESSVVITNYGNGAATQEVYTC
jgi:uncharacterized repeat protein (TIGR01451 family)